MATSPLRAKTAGSLVDRYGKWALVAGASEGIGEAFAAELAAAGMDLVLVARREEPLRALCARLESAHGVRAIAAPLDLGAADLPERAADLVKGREIGLFVHNAAFAPRGPFSEETLEASLQAIDVNCKSPLTLLHAALPGMIARRRGAIVIMSSLTAFQGSPYISVYGATKAFGLTLAEGLWAELAPLGIDVLACCAGATRTPAYLRAMSATAPGEMEPAAVAAEALASLGKGPFMVPGAFNRAASLLMRRLLPRTRAVRLMAAQASKIRGSR